MPFVSVIMNVYNGAPFLRQSLDSLMAQSFQDWELIFWDDCSTDESVRILEHYRDDRIRFIVSPTLVPLARARELAMREARGQLLAFLDQDDLWLPDKLARQVHLFRRRPDLGIVYGRAVRFDDRGLFADYDHRYEFRALPEGRIFTRLLCQPCFIAMSAAMIRRDALQAILPIPTEVEVCPDYYLFLGLAENHPVAAVQDVVCHYRVHAGNMSHGVGHRMHQEILWLMDRWADHLEPRTLAHRRRVHHTVLATIDMRHHGFAAGLKRLMKQGSVLHLFTRPFAQAFRRIRRHLSRPCWQRPGPAQPPAPPTDRPAEPSVHPRPVVIRTSVTACTFRGAVDALADMVHRGHGGYVSPANAYSTVLARNDPHYRQAVNSASFVTADGMPVVWALRWLGYDAERVHNDDLFLACCERFPEWRHFFVGGRTGQPEQVADELRQRFSGIRIVGTSPTPLRPVPPDQTRHILQQIESAQPSIVWVGMGTPAQDYWMSDVAAQAGVPMVGVGSAFDLLSGRSRPAPQWMKRHGLQWLFRLAQEPRRLAFRYLWYNLQFVASLAYQLTCHCLSRKART